MSRLLEIRRHSVRRRDGELSQEGVELARALGAAMGPYERVVTSPVPRAVHTAVAMGFAVDEQHTGLAMPGAAVDAECAGARRFTDAALAVRRSPQVARFAQEQAALWRALLEQVGYGASLLVISHSVTIELGVVAVCGEDPRALVRLGAGLGYCDGVRLMLDVEAGSCVEVEVLRARRAATTLV